MKSISFLGAFTKLLRVTISLVMSVLPYVCQPIQVEQFSSCWTDFYEIWYL